MILEIVRKSSSGSTSIIEKIHYLETEINYKSRASYVLLREHLRLQDKDYLESLATRMEMIEFSRDFLTKEKELKGDLVCSYCKKPHLVIEYEGMIVPNDIKATIDHIIAISQGGEKKNPKNIKVSCSKCNTKKGNKSLEEFLKLIPVLVP